MAVGLGFCRVSFPDLIGFSSDIDMLLAAIDKMLLQTEDKSKEERIIRSGYIHSATFWSGAVH